MSTYSQICRVLDIAAQALAKMAIEQSRLSKNNQQTATRRATLSGPGDTPHTFSKSTTSGTQVKHTRAGAVAPYNRQPRINRSLCTKCHAHNDESKSAHEPDMTKRGDLENKLHNINSHSAGSDAACC
jgi:hypothetical protein